MRAYDKESVLHPTEDQIAAKRYALYEKTRRSEVRIIDPKAHGIGFLYPPADSPEDWEERVPKWIFEFWDYIVRGTLHLSGRPQVGWIVRK